MNYAIISKKTLRLLIINSLSFLNKYNVQVMNGFLSEAARRMGRKGVQALGLHDDQIFKFFVTL